MNGEINRQDNARFFEYGCVDLQEHDFNTRQASVEIRMPFILMQTVTPSLLAAGIIDNFRLMDPLSVWMPQLFEVRLNQIGASAPGAAHLINKTLKERVEDSIRIFSGFSHFLSDPSDIIPFLPLGTYVTFRYRMRVDNILSVIESINIYNHITGVAEFQAALASVLYEILYLFERRNRLTPKREGI